MTDVWAEDLSPEDIQVAVDAVAAMGGGTVHVPPGDSPFDVDPNKKYNGVPVGVLIPGGVNIIGAGKDLTILRLTRSDINDPNLFYVDGKNGQRPRISGITFVGNVADENLAGRGIRMLRATDYRIDHCKFINFAASAVVASNYLEPYGANRGVVDHCDFDNPYKDDPNIIGAGGGGRKVWGYGVHVVGTSYNWENNIDNLLGKYDGLSNIVYVEDCTFSRTRHALTSNGGAFYVVRYSTFIEPRAEHFPMIDVHGSSGVDPAVGGRGLEAYNNLIYGCEYKWQSSPPYRWVSIAMGIRGGGGVIFNNQYVDCGKGTQLLVEDLQPLRCRVKDLYVWNNQMVKQNSPTDGVLFEADARLAENVDYFRYAKPNYAIYPYPHPFASEMNTHNLLVRSSPVSNIPFTIRRV